jgi:hypothetical protein
MAKGNVTQKTTIDLLTRLVAQLEFLEYGLAGHAELRAYEPCDAMTELVVDLQVEVRAELDRLTGAEDKTDIPRVA